MSHNHHNQEYIFVLCCIFCTISQELWPFHWIRIIKYEVKCPSEVVSRIPSRGSSRNTRTVKCLCIEVHPHCQGLGILAKVTVQHPTSGKCMEMGYWNPTWRSVRRMMIEASTLYWQPSTSQGMIMDWPSATTLSHISYQLSTPFRDTASACRVSTAMHKSSGAS